MNVWIQFSICAIVILFAGSQLSRHGDVIAEKTGLGRSWIGLVLLATVTSLPELITGVSAVTLNDLPNMAVSGTLGSCMFNVLVIAGLDLLSKNRPVSHMVHEGHILSAGFGIVLVGLAVVDMLFGKYLPVLTLLNSIDPISLVFIVVYLIAIRIIFNFERQRVEDFAGEIADLTHTEKSLARSVTIFVLNSILIVGSACYLPALGEEIAKTTGWGESFIGSSFIAITTSLPEITVSVAAARMGAFDMAVANLLGSNLFNIVILAATDMCYLKGPLLRSVSEINTLPALTVLIAMGIVVIGLTYRSGKKFWLLAGDAIAIAFVYILATVLLFVAH
jgi:cation:H+ antiporter